MSREAPDRPEMDTPTSIDSAQCVFRESRLEFFFLRGDELVARVMLAKEATPGVLPSMKELLQFLVNSGVLANPNEPTGERWTQRGSEFPLATGDSRSSPWGQSETL